MKHTTIPQTTVKTKTHKTAAVPPTMIPIPSVVFLAVAVAVVVVLVSVHALSMLGPEQKYFTEYSIDNTLIRLLPSVDTHSSNMLFRS